MGLAVNVLKAGDYALYGYMKAGLWIAKAEEATRLAGKKRTVTHLPDDHEQIDAHHSLQGRLWVEPAYVGPACRGEL